MIQSQKLKVVFFSPSCRHLGDKDLEPWAPLGALSLASFLEARDTAVCSVYLKRSYDRLTVKTYLDENEPDVVGITCFTHNRFSCIELAQMVKKRDPKAIVVLGGPHASFMDQQMMKAYPCIDAIVRGEGEMVFGEVIDHLRARIGLYRVKGITFRHRGRVRRNADRPRLTSLSDLPLINYQRFDICMPSWGGGFSVHRYLPIETARGCPGKCSFCITPRLWGHRLSFRSVDKVVAQLRLVPEEWRDKIVFPDMNFSVDRHYVRDLCQAIIKSRLNIQWACQTRIDLIDRPTLVWMKKAGCRSVTYGVETFSDKILKSIPKPFNTEKAVAVSNMTVGLGFKTRLNLLIGFPGETESTMKETLGNLMKLDSRVCGTLDYLRIMPGTDIYLRAIKAGFKESYWLEDHEESIPFYTSEMSMDVLKRWAELIRKFWKGYSWEPVSD